jgi:hypothetical protein
MRFAVRVCALAAAGLLAAAPVPVHLHASAVRTVDGRRVEIAVDQSGTQRTIRRCTGDLCSGSWFDGRRRWTFGVNEVPLPDAGPSDPDDRLARTLLAGARPDPAPFSPPAGAQPVFSGEGSVRLENAPVPIVPCALGGRAARCLLDTGSTPSTITLPLAEALGLEPHGEIAISAFGEFVTGLVDAGPLLLGAARFEQVRFAVIPSTAATPFDVVVGADLLGRVRVVLDRRAAAARIVAPSDQPLVGAMPLVFHDGVPHVTVTLDGRSEEALFDSGDAATVSLGYDAYREGPQWPVVGRSSASGIAGQDDALDVVVPAVSLDGVALGRTPAVVRRTQHGTHAGIGLWSRCVIELDERRERLGCTPNR